MYTQNVHHVVRLHDTDAVLLDLCPTVLPPNKRPGVAQSALLLLQLLRQTDAKTTIVKT